jgi:uncharacterized SAM-binding protein YcdF (DUF218 family)
VTLVLVCMPPVAYLALGTLEWAYRPQYDLPADVQVIVLLGGTVAPADDFEPRPQLTQETVIRCLKALQLYRESGPRLIAVSGGNPNPQQPGPACARVMAEFLVTHGAAAQDLLTEEQSRTTHENAVETSRLLADRGLQRIALVTSASHMRRAEYCFRARGLDVAPRACGHQATQFQWSVSSFLPSLHAAHNIQLVCHEWIGLMWYWLHGRL